MKLFLKTFLLALLVTPVSAQQTINGTITHDGLQRAYILYVPASYTEGTPSPLVLNFHGYTSNAFAQMLYGDFRPIADTAGFLVVHPEGTIDLLGNTHWNVGWGASSVDDVGFTAALIDSLSATYNINANRVYSTGMSNGGFFSYLLACSLSNRIAAIASVTGSMGTSLISTCNPSHQMPTMEIHGTADPTVPYQGNLLAAAIPDVIEFWVEENNANPTPVITAVPDINTGDNSTAEHYLYTNGDNGSTVEHYKIIGGGHAWPGAIVDIGVTNHDIDASQEIWRFFSSYDINGLIGTVATESVTTNKALHVYPNPTDHFITVAKSGASSESFALYNFIGQTVMTGTISDKQQLLDLSGLHPGMYVLKVGEETVMISSE